MPTHAVPSAADIPWAHVDDEGVPPSWRDDPPLSHWLRWLPGSEELDWVRPQPEAGVWKHHTDGVFAATNVGDDWLLGLHVVPYRGAWNVREAAFVPLRPVADVNLTTALLRTVPLGRVVDDVRRQAAVTLQASGSPSAELHELLGVWEGDQRTRGEGRPEWAWAVLAARYVQLVDGGSRRPAAALAGELNMTPGLVSQRILEARERGFLTPTTPGKSGGELTPRGQAVVFDQVQGVEIDEMFGRPDAPPPGASPRTPQTAESRS